MATLYASGIAAQTTAMVQAQPPINETVPLYACSKSQAQGGAAGKWQRKAPATFMTDIRVCTAACCSTRPIGVPQCAVPQAPKGSNKARRFSTAVQGVVNVRPMPRGPPIFVGQHGTPLDGGNVHIAPPPCFAPTY